MSRTFADVPIDRVADYWDARPCNSRHSPKPVGSEEYFHEVERRKYLVEPHIPAFADFPRWGGARVLEIGCGIGTDTINFARHGADVTAVDLSSRSLEIARRRAEVFGLTDRIRFLHCDAEQLRDALPGEQFDLVYSFGVIHHTPHPARVLGQIRPLLKPGGTLKLMVYHRRSWKALWILLTEGKGRFWALDELLARSSEAQTGCPVTYSYTPAGAKGLLERHGYTNIQAEVNHIFPYKISDYVRYKYTVVWYFRWMPRSLFRRLERAFGWHLCLTANAPS
jgi:2-polyprenyl-3-methyl-5-hydroxy-6-metoxy-1,4-benzoquinol methylase